MTTLLAFLASFVGAWAFFKYVILIEMRVDDNTYKTIYDLCKDDRKVMIYEEFVSENRYPVAYVAFCFFKEAPFFHIKMRTPIRRLLLIPGRFLLQRHK